MNEQKKASPPLKPTALINFKKTDDELAKIVGKNKAVGTSFQPSQP